ncbi:MAG TPA: hypothetical protein VMS77_01820 [Conexivisphaerales archaeon]|nr:hypothetical protein [Conexivisphaerales archaeon]
MADSARDTALIDAVLKMDRSIRYVALLSEGLGIVAQRMQDGTATYSPEFIDEVVVPIIAGMMKRLTEYAGEFELARMDYSKVSLILKRAHGGYLVISAEPSLDLDPICEKLSRLA